MKSKILLFALVAFCSNTASAQGFCFNGNAIYYSTQINHTFLSDITSGLFNADSIPDLAISWNTQLDLKFGNGDGSFTNGGSFISASPSNLKYIFSGDFDNDAHDDIACVNDYRSLYVAWGNSNGTFTETGTPLISGGTNQKALPADVNHDGLMDIIILDGTSSDLIVYLNQGNRVFTDSIFQLPFSSNYFGIGYFNNDTNLDIVFSSNPDIIYYNGDGAGNFNQGNTFASNIFNLNAIAGGDLNHDGVDDLVFMDNFNAYFAFRDTSGAITNRTSLRISTQTGGYYADDITVKDINQDNYPEVFINSSSSSNVAVIKNNAGALNLFSKYAGMPQCSRFCLRDADLDGYDDIISLSPQTVGFYSVIKGKTNSDFYGDVYPMGNANSFLYAENLCTGDLNNDGFNDLVTAGSDSVNILLNDGAGHFAHFAKIHVASNLSGIAIADFNHDNNNDIIVNGGSSGAVYELTGNGNATFNAPTLIYTCQGAQLAEVADFNNDTYADLAIGGASGLFILLNNGSGGLIFNSQVPNLYYTTGLAIGDFNNDGYKDIAELEYSGGGLINLNNHSGAFTNAQGFAICAGGHNGDIACADFNLDGNLDFAFTNYGCPAGNKAYVYYGDGSGNSSLQTSFAVTGLPNYLTAADVNLDGYPDLAVSTSYDLMHIALNNHNGAFTGPYILATGNGSMTVITDDFNHDSKADLACVNWGSEDVMVALNSLIKVFPGPDVDLCSGDSVLLYVTGVPGSFHWDPLFNLTSDSIYVTSAGTYTIVPDSVPFGQCISSTSVTVHLHTSPIVVFDHSNNPDTTCDSNPITLNATPPGGIFTGQNVAGNSFNPAGLSQGSYPITYTYTDVNGCTTSQPLNIFVLLCAELQDLNDGNTVNIFPNPAIDEITIQQSGSSIYDRAFLINSLGENVAAIKLSKNSETIHLENLIPGVYQLKFLRQKKSSIIRKIVVMK
ncbi:MAG: FG-GAP-like repeat-containing protein [Bacteroidota bacterium]